MRGILRGRAKHAASRLVIFDGAELPSLLSIEQASKVLNVDTATVAAWIETGQLDAVQTNGRLRVVTSSIEDRMNQPTFARRNDELQL